jgi:hypothetical protein
MWDYSPHAWEASVHLPMAAKEKFQKHPSKCNGEKRQTPSPPKGKGT